MPHPLDTFICEIRSLTRALNALVTGAGSQPNEQPAPVTSTASVQRYTNATHGKLAGRNPRRVGFKVHNATDGTLLIRFGTDRASLADGYNLAIGPGQHYETGELPQNVYQGEIRFAWVTASDDTTGYPDGTVLAATGGAASYTELSR